LNNQINELIIKIYNNDLSNIDIDIIDLLSKILNCSGVNQIEFMNLINTINVKIQEKNYVAVADILEYKLKKLI